MMFCRELCYEIRWSAEMVEVDRTLCVRQVLIAL